MTVLEWDKVGERVYQTGIDRGVLGLPDGTVVSWNGLTSVDDGTDTEVKSYYLDGIKILDHVTPGDFVGKLKAFTYPDEFEEVIGVNEAADGFFLHNQPSKKFNLSYRTRIGNDVEGETHGYKLHILYNLVAVQDSQTYDSLSNQGSASEFAWSLSGVPAWLNNFRPTTHVSIDSRRAFSENLQTLEDILYGTDVVDPRFPTLIEVGAIFSVFGALTITDNGDGTWTASDPTNTYITMLDPTEFRIDHANTTYLDADTYDISSTNL